MIKIKSSITGANALYGRFGRSGKYTFHRGDATVNRINSAFTRAKTTEGVRMDINKWNPSDIWMVKSDFDFKCIDQMKKLPIRIKSMHTRENLNMEN